MTSPRRGDLHVCPVWMWCSLRLRQFTHDQRFDGRRASVPDPDGYFHLRGETRSHRGEGIKAFVGDGACNVPVSWIFAAAKLGFELRIACLRRTNSPASLLARAGRKAFALMIWRRRK